jgi:hypothetical protein
MYEHSYHIDFGAKAANAHAVLASACSASSPARRRSNLSSEGSSATWSSARSAARSVGSSASSRSFNSDAVPACGASAETLLEAGDALLEQGALVDPGDRQEGVDRGLEIFPRQLAADRGPIGCPHLAPDVGEGGQPDSCVRRTP